MGQLCALGVVIVHADLPKPCPSLVRVYGEVLPLVGLGVARILESKNPGFQLGDATRSLPR
jgi:hypothetical protein